MDAFVCKPLVEIVVTVRCIRRNGRELRAVCKRTSNIVLDDDDFVYLARIHLCVKVTVAKCRRLWSLMTAGHVVGDRPHNEEHKRIKSKISKD